MRFSLVGPAKVKACKPFVFTRKYPVVKHKEHLFDLNITLFNSCE